jgi:cytochrome oxidase Cu insertion factor (SCO1/SenC/PrrC family)
MNPDIKKRLIRTVILCTIALCVGLGVGAYQIKMENERRNTGDPDQPRPSVAGMKIGGPFTLMDHNGNKVTEKDFEDRYKFVYFGFTYCPAICPTELQKMNQVLAKLPGEMTAKIAPIFITIDPERDTAEVMKDYVGLFHPDLIGLTGTQPQIDFVLKSYRIFATKVDDPDLSEYTMDHSTFLYLMAPDNELVGLYRMSDDADYMVKDIKSKL